MENWRKKYVFNSCRPTNESGYEKKALVPIIIKFIFVSIFLDSFIGRNYVNAAGFEKGMGNKLKYYE